MTMLAHLKPITADKAQPGDLVVFGGDPGDQHVVVIVEPGADPTVTSHGSESAPFKLPLSAVADAHTGQPQIVPRADVVLSAPIGAQRLGAVSDRAF